MADVTLAGNTNYSALTLSNGDRILLAGYTLTFDVIPAHSNITVTAAGNAGKVNFTSTSGAYNLTGWTFQAGTGSCVQTNARTINGGTFIGGSASGAHGCVETDGNVTGATFIGGSASGAHGLNAVYGSQYSCTYIGGTVSGAHGCAGNSHLQSGGAYRSSVSGAFGCSNFAAIVRPVELTSTASGAYPISNNRFVLADLRLISGPASIYRNTSQSDIVLFGGSSCATLGLALGTVQYIAAPADVRLGVSVLSETGTLSAHPVIQPMVDE